MYPVKKDHHYYNLIAFHKRVTFSLYRTHPLPCVRAYVALYARRLTYNHYASAHANKATNTSTRQWPGALKSKCYSLVEGNQTIVVMSLQLYQHQDAGIEDMYWKKKNK